MLKVRDEYSGGYCLAMWLDIVELDNDKLVGGYWIVIDEENSSKIFSNEDFKRRFHT